MDGAQTKAFDDEVFAFIRGDDGLSFQSIVACLFVLAKARAATDPLRVLVMMNERERRNAVCDSLERLWKAGRAVETEKKWSAVRPQEVSQQKQIQRSLIDGL